MSAYYNELDPAAAAWLRELIKAGQIAPGIVDERSIEDVLPNELRGFTQCHFFAGIGVWSYALRRAGWSDDRPVWTGSCPCQPFSAAGKGDGFADERHLWPAFNHLISQCRPNVVFGEQVASKDADTWIDLVHADMEALGYAFGSVPFPSASVGAPHIRDRNYWVAYTSDERLEGRCSTECSKQWSNGQAIALRTPDREYGELGFVGDTSSNRCTGERKTGETETRQRSVSTADKCRELQTGLEGSGIEPFGGMAHSNQDGCEPRVAVRSNGEEHDTEHGSDANLIRSTVPTNGFWRDADWLFCRDGKWRPVEPGTSPLADGAAARVGRLRGYGNAINAEQAKIFIESYLETKTA